MALGPGKYDELCSYVRRQSGAHSAIVIVFDGDRGSGCSCQTNAQVLLRLPDILERLAAQIRQGGVLSEF